MIQLAKCQVNRNVATFIDKPYSAHSVHVRSLDIARHLYLSLSLSLLLFTIVGSVNNRYITFSHFDHERISCQGEKLRNVQYNINNNNNSNT